MAHKQILRRGAGALALGAVVLGAAGFAGARQTPQNHPAALPHAGAHVLQYVNVATDWPKTFDPANVTDSQSIMVINMLYGNLVKLNQQNQVVPDLATWTVSGDRMTYTFHLRNTKFSDGKSVTADDAIYSIDRALNPKVYNGSASPVAGLYLAPITGASAYKGTGDVKGLKKVDAHTLQIHLDKPYAYFLETLTYPTADILEKGKTPMNSLVTKNPLQNQISSGPWKISKFSYKNSLTFVPNTGWYDAKNLKLHEVDMPFVKDSDTAYQGYESGQYAVTSVPTNRLAAARSMPDFHTTPILAIDYISYNMAKPPFNNRDLRLAATYAIDRNTIDAKVLHGAQKPLYSVIPQGILGYDANGQKFTPTYNPTLAKQYLAKAKKEMGKNFPSQLTIKYQNTSSDVVHEYTELQYEWKQIGLNVKIQGVTFDTWLGLVAKPTTSVTYKGGDPWVENLWIDDYPDGQDFTSNLLTPTTSYNVGNYNSPSFNDLTNQALTASPVKREQLYIKASRQALNDVAWSMIGQQTTNWRWKSNIKGLVLWSGEANPYPQGNDWTNVDVQ